MANTKRKEFGDWQTNESLALSVCRLLKSQGIHPKILIEPTCGVGNFVMAALQVFEDDIEDVIALEINSDYFETMKHKTSASKGNRNINFHFFNQDFFRFDFATIKPLFNNREILVLGNPPWVTNSMLSGLNSENLPLKNNFKKQRGIDAITGKGNFDVAEFICLEMLRLVQNQPAHLALLLKTSVIKNILYYQHREPLKFDNFRQYNIDANKEFSAAVSAALFECSTSPSNGKTCTIYDFYTQKKVSDFGWLNGAFVADIGLYQSCGKFDALSQFVWRSGIKHDCSKVMELTFDGENYINGFGEIVDIENECIFPLIKSADIKENGIGVVKNYVIITQKKTSENTRKLLEQCPKLYQYLSKYSDLLDGRKSTIYRNRPRFCLFGIGEYSFAPYKIAISGLYKHTQCAILSQIDGKAIMVDDTCYAVGFPNEESAKIMLKVMNNSITQQLLKSITFSESKRIINKDVLMRIDVKKIAENILSVSEMKTLFSTAEQTLFD